MLPFPKDCNDSNYSLSEPLSDTDYVNDKRAARLEAEQQAFTQLEKAQVGANGHPALTLNLTAYSTIHYLFFTDI